MYALNLTDGDITHRREIVQILDMAAEQRWSFSYVKTSRKRVSTHSLDLYSVNASEGSFSASNISEASQLSPDESLMFRAQSGGISIVFQSRVAQRNPDSPSTKPASILDFELPYKIACTQLRRTPRLDLEAFGDVPVVIHLTHGAMIEGTVVDISSSGAKFSVPQEAAAEIKNPKVVEACRIDLPNDFILTTGLQLIGKSDVEKAKLTYLRCQFYQMQQKDEDRLSRFVDDSLQEAEAAADVAASG